MNVEMNVKDRVLRPVSEVFAAIVDPTKMSGFFISSATGPMTPGESIEWIFADVGMRLSIDMKEVEENRIVVFDWLASGVKARVAINLDGARQ